MVEATELKHKKKTIIFKVKHELIHTRGKKKSGTVVTLGTLDTS